MVCRKIKAYLNITVLLSLFLLYCIDYFINVRFFDDNMLGCYLSYYIFFFTNTYNYVLYYYYMYVFIDIVLFFAGPNLGEGNKGFSPGAISNSDY